MSKISKSSSESTSKVKKESSATKNKIKPSLNKKNEIKAIVFRNEKFNKNEFKESKVIQETIETSASHIPLKPIFKFPNKISNFIQPKPVKEDLNSNKFFYSSNFSFNKMEEKSNIKKEIYNLLTYNKQNPDEEDKNKFLNTKHSNYSKLFDDNLSKYNSGQTLNTSNLNLSNLNSGNLLQSSSLFPTVNSFEVKEDNFNNEPYSFRENLKPIVSKFETLNLIIIS